MTTTTSNDAILKITFDATENFDFEIGATTRRCDLSRRGASVALRLDFETRVDTGFDTGAVRTRRTGAGRSANTADISAPRPS